MLQLSNLKMMLEAVDMFLPPYCSVIQRGRGTTFHVLRHSAANCVKFHGLYSNMSLTPSLQIGITISVQLCSKNDSDKLVLEPCSTKKTVAIDSGFTIHILWTGLSKWQSNSSYKTSRFIQRCIMQNAPIPWSCCMTNLCLSKQTQ